MCTHMGSDVAGVGGECGARLRDRTAVRVRLGRHVGRLGLAARRISRVATIPSITTRDRHSCYRTVCDTAVTTAEASTKMGLGNGGVAEPTSWEKAEQGIRRGPGQDYKPRLRAMISSWISVVPVGDGLW
jgi:hypothetical protein